MDCKNILIIEDDFAISSMMQDILEGEGYRVFSAADGAEGIEKLNALSPLPCLIILDLMMPGTNGWKFLDYQRAQPHLVKIPVIVCSAYRESARSVHANAIIDKPIRLESFLGKVNEFCA